jgi:signal peptidase I
MKPRPKPNNFAQTFIELWNDPRPVSSLFTNGDRSNVGFIYQSNDETEITKNVIPYCIISDEFEFESQSFQILLYPRGRFVSGTNPDNPQSMSITEPASAYLRYLPKEYGDEVDIAWTLQLVDTRTSMPLKVLTSGGLPMSNTTWSAAMTFCTEIEAIESVGRATDWGSSTWFAKDVCEALGYIKAVGTITIFDRRTGESSFALPFASKGGLGAVKKSVVDSSSDGPRDFRVGEVIVPIKIDKDDRGLQDRLVSSFIYPGVDYRIMTMTDQDGNSIFSTTSLPQDKRRFARLALRPCGWKLQKQLWQKDGLKKEWPTEIEAGLLDHITLSRFNPGSAIPRVTSAFKRDWVTYTIALLVAIMPIPAALVFRNAASFYAIPSSSMEPTLMKGDVLLVEKFPGIYDRTKKGDVILFRPPETLKKIISNNGGSPISSSSLFVKRVVGLPGDVNIEMDELTKDVSVKGEPSVGPDRNLCDDEPLRLIDRLLIDGQGKSISKLGDDEVYVLGDCKAVSVDSRVFGVLPKDSIVGKPISRLWPPNRFSLGPF